MFVFVYNQNKTPKQSGGIVLMFDCLFLSVPRGASGALREVLGAFKWGSSAPNAMPVHVSAFEKSAQTNVTQRQSTEIKSCQGCFLCVVSPILLIFLYILIYLSINKKLGLCKWGKNFL